VAGASDIGCTVLAAAAFCYSFSGFRGQVSTVGMLTLPGNAQKKGVAWDPVFVIDYKRRSDFHPSHIEG
jgi:hypothetical protein